MGEYGKDEESIVSKDSTIHYRIAGHTIMLFLYLKLVIFVNMAIWEQLPKHPELQIFVDLGPRYATAWNMVIQIIYSSLALACDVTEVMNKEHLVPKRLRKFRYTLFLGLFYPVGMIISITFWPLYLYDREIIFPSEVDLIMTLCENIVCHGLVTVYALYELIFIPRDSIKNLRPYWYILCFSICYLTVFFYTKYDLGVWTYVVFNNLEGTLLFYIILGYPFFFAGVFYLTVGYTQDLIWKIRDILGKNIECN